VAAHVQVADLVLDVRAAVDHARTHARSVRELELSEKFNRIFRFLFHKCFFFFF
jgi:hypothetical protein